MKLAVIAANGRSGQAFVEAALAAGHTVTAGVHTKSSLSAHPRLQIMSVDATKEEDLQALCSGQDAVVSLLGHVKGSMPDVQTVATHKIIAAMTRGGITRFVSVTGTGVRFPGDQITLIDRFLNLGVSLVDPSRVRDGKNHVAVLQSSGMDWTVIRVLKLQNVPAKAFRLSLHGPTKVYVGRQEVAQAILEVLEQNSFTRQAPIISKQ